MHRCWQTLLPLVLSLGIANVAAAGETLYAPCAACHGENGEGNPALNAPALAAQSAAYVSRQLRNFKNGVRGAADGDIYGAQMLPFAATLKDDNDIQVIADFVAAMPAVSTLPSIDGDSAAGEKQYQSKCGACHGSSGQGNDALNSPRIVGIGDAYLVRQVKAYQSGLRGAAAGDTYGKQMAMMAALVRDAELHDIAAYLNETSAER
jgi:cytochrome c553